MNCMKNSLMKLYIDLMMGFMAMIYIKGYANNIVFSR